MPTEDKTNENTAPAPGDVDSMSDEDFAKVLDGMRDEPQSDDDVFAAAEAAAAAEAEADAKAKAEVAAAETETEADAEAEEKPAEDGDDDEPATNMVPHSRFNAANERRKEAEAQLAREREDRIRLESRMEALTEVMRRAQEQAQQQGQVDEGIPDVAEDPEAYFRYLEDNLARQNETIQQLQQRQQQEAQRQQVVQAYQADLQRVAQAKPDLGEAMRFLATQRRQEMAALGITDESRIAQVLQQDEFRIINHATQTGNSPGELLYAIASSRGYLSPEQRKQLQAQVAEAEAKEAEAKANANATAQSEAEKVAAQEAARQAAASLGGPGAPAPSGDDISPEAIINMSESEFRKFKEKFGEGALSHVFGE